MQAIEKTKIQDKTFLGYKGSHNFYIISTLSIIQSLRNFKNHSCWEQLQTNLKILIEKAEHVTEYYLLTTEYSKFKKLLQKLQDFPSKKLEKLKPMQLRIISIGFRCILITLCSKVPDEILAGTVKFKKSFYYSILNAISSLLGITFVIREDNLSDSDSKDDSFLGFQENLKVFEAPINESPIVELRVDPNTLLFYLVRSNGQNDLLNKEKRLLEVLESLSTKRLFKKADEDEDEAEVIYK